MIVENSFIETNKYGGLAVDIHNGVYKIVRAQVGKDGKTYAEWAFPQRRIDGGWEPKEKAVPVAVTLGSDKDAINRILKTVADIIETDESKETGGVPDEHKTEGQSDHGEQIPF